LTLILLTFFASFSVLLTSFTRKGKERKEKKKKEKKRREEKNRYMV
jgi:membrane protein implicated in regulation of membrane protease activity